MNVLNRIWVIVDLLLAMVLCTVLLIFPHTLLPTIGAWLIEVGQGLNQLDPWLRFGFGVLLAVLLNTLALIWIVLELRKPKRYLKVETLEGATVKVLAESVALQIQYRLDPLPGVIRVKSAVGVKQGRVKAHAEVNVPLGVDVLDTAQRCVEAVRAAVTEDLGLALAEDPVVHVNVINVPRDTQRPVAPPPPPPAPPVPPRYPGAEGQFAATEEKPQA